MPLKNDVKIVLQQGLDNYLMGRVPWRKFADNTNILNAVLFHFFRNSFDFRRDDGLNFSAPMIN